MVQIGPHDERPSPGSQASEAAGASTESTPDTVKIPKISPDQPQTPGGESSHAEPLRSLSPSGTFPSGDAGLPGVPASVPTAASPSGAWPADSRPISLTDSVFTPWSARQAPGSDSRDTASAPSEPEPADDKANGPAGAGLLAGVDSLTKRPASGDPAKRGSRPSGPAHDPLSGPWPSFTRRTGEIIQTIPAREPDDAEQPAGPRFVAAETAPAGTAADEFAAAGTAADEFAAAGTAADESAAAGTAADETAAEDEFASLGGGPTWAAAPASPLGATEFTAFASPPWRTASSASPGSPGGLGPSHQDMLRHDLVWPASDEGFAAGAS
ncbi:MAG TPA: hypothetical protein VF506_01205, partial [Streptosporangiaceae bacterium]